VCMFIHKLFILDAIVRDKDKRLKCDGFTCSSEY